MPEDRASGELARAALPPITVAIATHNAGPRLREAVGSALEQVPPPVEVVVCDDGSTDGSVVGLEDLDARVRVVRHPRNLGEAAAKNTAVRESRTELVALLDADDLYLPGRLAAICSVFDADPLVDIVTTDAWLVHGGETVGRWYSADHPAPNTEDQRIAVLSRNPVFGHAAVRRAAFDGVGGFDVELPFATDWDCWLRMVLAGARIAVIPEPLAIYRLHEGSSSADRQRMALGRVAILRRALARDDLSPDERRAAEHKLDEQLRLHRREELKGGLHRTQSGTQATRLELRRLAAVVARDAGQPPRSRALAWGVLLAPGPARALWTRRARTRWTGPGGRTLVRRDPAAD